MRGAIDLCTRRPPAWCTSLHGNESACAAAYVRYVHPRYGFVARCRYNAIVDFALPHKV